MTDITHLMLRARTGDLDAFAEIVKASQSDVQRFCAGCVNWTEAADLAQETYVRAWKSLASYNGEASGQAWLFGVARHVVADHVRRTARRSGIRRFHAMSLEGDTSIDQRDLAASNGTQRIELEELIAQLNPDQREAFVLTQIVGLSYEEAADSANVAVGTIRSRVARARAQLIHAFTAAESSFADDADANGSGAVSPSVGGRSTEGRSA
jgi:RNA polymerase sigma-70 factor, ECF subfamily